VTVLKIAVRFGCTYH